MSSSSGENPRPVGMGAPIALLVVCLIGALVSGLSTRDHVRFRVSGSTEGGACAALVDSGCKSAHSSTAAEILGVPISHLGTGFYLGCASLAIAALALRRQAARDRDPASGIAPVVTLMGTGAVGYSMFLAAILIRSGEACPLCIALYAVNMAMLVLGIVWWRQGRHRLDLRAFVLPATVAPVVGAGFLVATTPWLLGRLSATGPATVAGPVIAPSALPRSFALPPGLPSKGATDAENDLVEFADLDCSHCSAMHRTVSAVYEERGPSRLRVRFVNYPLDQECNGHAPRSVHPSACLAARGAICAQAQDRFWPYVDAYFALAEPGSRAVVLSAAKDVGLEMEAFTQCLDAEETARALADQVALGHAAAVRATPTLLVNGQTFEGVLPRERLVKILDDAKPRGCEGRSPEGACGRGASVNFGKPEDSRL